MFEAMKPFIKIGVVSGAALGVCYIGEMFMRDRRGEKTHNDLKKQFSAWQALPGDKK